MFFDEFLAQQKPQAGSRFAVGTTGRLVGVDAEQLIDLLFLSMVDIQILLIVKEFQQMDMPLIVIITVAY